MTAGPAPPRPVRLTVTAADAGVRVDTFLHRHLRNHSPARLARLALAGAVTLADGRPVTPRHRVTAGETLAVAPRDPPDWAEDAESSPLDVLFEDPWLLAVNKPPHVICHPTGATVDGTVVNFAQAHLDRRAARGLLRPGVVHRLDGATSGALLLGKVSANPAVVEAIFATQQAWLEGYRL